MGKRFGGEVKEGQTVKVVQIRRSEERIRGKLSVNKSGYVGWISIASTCENKWEWATFIPQKIFPPASSLNPLSRVKSPWKLKPRFIPKVSMKIAKRRTRKNMTRIMDLKNLSFILNQNQNPYLRGPPQPRREPRNPLKRKPDPKIPPSVPKNYLSRISKPASRSRTSIFDPAPVVRRLAPADRNSNVPQNSDENDNPTSKVAASEPFTIPSEDLPNSLEEVYLLLDNAEQVLTTLFPDSTPPPGDSELSIMSHIKYFDDSPHRSPRRIKTKRDRRRSPSRSSGRWRPASPSQENPHHRSGIEALDRCPLVAQSENGTGIENAIELAIGMGVPIGIVSHTESVTERVAVRGGALAHRLIASASIPNLPQSYPLRSVNITLKKASVGWRIATEESQQEEIIPSIAKASLLET
eukprot:TRINITY_DN867_c0_g2_i3.p1 TRINITY_DN867_c0_g2~~TRINITY_DN867_c0_g2_i3.p1  ORF type:complete len:427 (-),score=59.65 TRINITY_DN867_c0_g2_i3:103-1335(-)